MGWATTAVGTLSDGMSIDDPGTLSGTFYYAVSVTRPGNGVSRSDTLDPLWQQD